MRDDNWLWQLLDTTWDSYFADVAQDNTVKIVWGRKARTRLGSIKLDPKDRSVSVITLNGLFKNPEIPEFVLQATLVHELSHYSHGFNSPVEQKFRHPHAGGVMRQEFAERGLEQLYVDQRKWLKANWADVVKSNFAAPVVRRRARAKKVTRVPKPFWFLDY